MTLILAKDDTCTVGFHYLHQGVMDLVTYEDDIKKIVHRTIMRRVRPMLHTLAFMGTVQRGMERQRRAQASAMGSATSLKRVVDPTIFHDACTLYMGCASGFYGYHGFGGHQGSWFAASRCGGCGHNSWGMTCTPPRITKHGTLVRDTYDHLVAFCWICLARPADTQ